MKAIVRYRYGSLDVLELREVAMPVVKDENVLVRVRAASLNTDDLQYVYGNTLLARLGSGFGKPRNPRLGSDVAGEVAAVGKLVTHLRPGDEVFGDLSVHGFGAFAEYVSAPARAFALKPARLTFAEAATVPLAGILALQGLRGKRQIKRGDHVLINGAGGSVGPFAVQIARHFGAEVTGVDSAGKLDMVRSIGADHVIDYTREDFTRSGQRYDRILDVVSPRSMFECRRALGPDGVYVMLGGSTARIIQGALLGPLISATGRKKLSVMWWWKPFPQDDVAFLTKLIDAGTVRPVIDRTFPLSEGVEAFRHVGDGHARGKVVITME